jgi:hypothetical protein
MGIENLLRMVIDLDHFRQAVRDAAGHRFDVLHLSCHGGDDGIALCDDARLSWEELALIFETMQYNPTALVMSTCCGAASGIGDAFQVCKYGPDIIFGSKVPLNISDYCVAWAILYHQLILDGVTLQAARTAMKNINAVVTNEFVYRRWDADASRYLYYPAKNRTYSVVEDKPG